MIDLKQLEALKKWGKQDLPGRPVAQAHADIARGSVYWYLFREERVEKGEVYKKRPVIVMARSPFDRLKDQLDLWVVPVSKQLDHSYGQGVTINLEGEGSRTAVTCQATTINSNRLGDFHSVVCKNDMDRISSALNQHLLVANGALKGHLRPGNIFNIPWHDKDHMRAVVIVSAGHIANTAVPILVLPFKTINDAYGEKPLIKPRPVARERLYAGEALGKVNPKILEEARCDVRRNFGLIS